MRPILVLGDCILDRTIHVKVKGPSAENQNTLVVDKGHTTYNLGGAGNVAANVKSLGGDVTFFGYNRLYDSINGRFDLMLAEQQIPFHMELTVSDMPVKTRIVSPGGMLLRIDEEDQPDLKNWMKEGSSNILRKLESALENAPEGGPVVCLVDYDKGFFNKDTTNACIELLDDSTDTVIVDPGRTGDWERYSSCNTIFKVNLKQCRSILPRQQLDGDTVYQGAMYSVLADALFAELGRRGIAFRGIYLTLSAGGVIYIDDQRVSYHAEGRSVPIVDPTGAGDTVMATIAVMLASGRTVRQACSAANLAASIACGHRGVYAVKAREVGKVFLESY